MELVAIIDLGIKMEFFAIAGYLFGTFGFFYAMRNLYSITKLKEKIRMLEDRINTLDS